MKILRSLAGAAVVIVALATLLWVLGLTKYLLAWLGIE